MKMNAPMRMLLEDAAFVPPLNPLLSAIADSGFDRRGDCYFLAALFTTAKNVTRENFPDNTGYECFVNSIHVEDYDSKSPFLQTMSFVVQVFKVWLASTPKMKLVAIISVGEFGVVVRFHVKRPDENWLSENIDGYQDPTMSIESSEDLLSSIAALRERYL